MVAVVVGVGVVVVVVVVVVVGVITEPIRSQFRNFDLTRAREVVECAA